MRSLEQLINMRRLSGDRHNRVKFSVAEKLILEKYLYWITDMGYLGHNLFDDLPNLFQNPPYMIKVCVGHIPKRGYYTGVIPLLNPKTIREMIELVGEQIKTMRKQFKKEKRKL